MEGSRRTAILATHLILTGYGHWFPNDPRGTGSEEVKKEGLRPLGEILPGRQIPQPPKQVLRAFFRKAEPKLQHELIWFDEARRQTVVAGFTQAATQFGWTAWACAVCSNHAHLVVRTHRDRSEVIWSRLADFARLALRGANLAPRVHPVWSRRPYKVFLHSPAQVVQRIQYVENNPMKEGLDRQTWAFVKPSPY